jgi:hypothetical protein
VKWLRGGEMATGSYEKVKWLQGGEMGEMVTRR